MYTPFTTNIDAIETPDDATIVFHLKTPSAAFLTATLSKINLIPKHVWEPLLTGLAGTADNAETVQEATPIGSGPYRFGSWTTNEEIVLTANPDHWAAPKAERWILRIVPNTEAALGMLRSGEINFLSDFSGDPAVILAAAEADGDLEVVSTVDIGFRYVAFNHRRPPFDDPAFRNALSAAVNRDLIVNAAFRGFAVKSNSVVSPALEFWHNAALDDSLETGIDPAKAILEAAGYTLVDGKLHYPDGVTETLAE
jgi:peptide/nickel transport system substrate-binding protein